MLLGLAAAVKIMAVVMLPFAVLIAARRGSVAGCSPSPLVTLWPRCARKQDTTVRAALRAGGLAFAATVALAPSFHPWYALAPLVLMSATTVRTELVMATAVARSLSVLPNGDGLARFVRFPGAIRFLEAGLAAGRRELVESNITPWRRAVVGDLTTAFDFTTPNRTRPVPLPDTAAFLPDDLVRHPDQVPVPPTGQRLPPQERGVRPARALPYQLHADAALAAGRLTLAFRNTGAATAVFQAYSGGAKQHAATPSSRAGR